MTTDGKGKTIGEIDTNAPFRSVKAALSMFGESAFSPYKSPMVSRSKPNQADIEVQINPSPSFLVRYFENTYLPKYPHAIFFLGRNSSEISII